MHWFGFFGFFGFFHCFRKGNQINVMVFIGFPKVLIGFSFKIDFTKVLVCFSWKNKGFP